MERQINRTSFLIFLLFLLLSHFNVSISKYLLVFGFTFLFTLSILSIYSMNLLVLICLMTLIFAGFTCQDDDDDDNNNN